LLDPDDEDTPIADDNRPDVIIHELRELLDIFPVRDPVYGSR
jgi:hypothetical protein